MLFFSRLQIGSGKEDVLKSCHCEYSNVLKFLTIKMMSQNQRTLQPCTEFLLVCMELSLPRIITGADIFH